MLERRLKMSLKDLRKNSKLTQSELATLVGVSPEAICQYEKKKRKPSYEIVSKLSKELNCTEKQIIECFK